MYSSRGVLLELGMKGGRHFHGTGRVERGDQRQGVFVETRVLAVMGVCSCKGDRNERVSK